MCAFKAYRAVLQLEIDHINDQWRTVHMTVELASRTAAKNDGVAMRLDVLDILFWNRWPTCKRLSVISQKMNGMWKY